MLAPLGPIVDGMPRSGALNAPVSGVRYEVADADATRRMGCDDDDAAVVVLKDDDRSRELPPLPPRLLALLRLLSGGGALMLGDGDKLRPAPPPATDDAAAAACVIRCCPCKPRPPLLVPALPEPPPRLRCEGAYGGGGP